jgi:signal transduction histidine kinase
LVDGGFVLELVHDLRSSLTVISLLSRRLEGVEQPQLLAELGQMQRLLTGVSQLAQLDDLSAAPRQPVNLARLAREEMARQQPLAQRKGQRLGWTGPDSLLVWGDAELLGWLLHHLLDNALTYTPDGGEIECHWAEVNRAELGPEWPGRETLPVRRQRWAALQLRDSGGGVAAAELSHIFEPFYRGQAAKPIAGAGLGLTVVREVVRLHRGHLAVESTPGEGSRWAVYLPLAR